MRTPAPLRVGAAERVPDLIRDFETHGVEYWARQNMGDRLGSAFPPEGFEWWTKFIHGSEEERAALMQEASKTHTAPSSSSRRRRSRRRPAAAA